MTIPSWRLSLRLFSRQRSKLPRPTCPRWACPLQKYLDRHRMASDQTLALALAPQAASVRGLELELVPAQAAARAAASSTSAAALPLPEFSTSPTLSTR